ncbi:MAG: hypothetical protein MUD02_00990 [Bacteroidales bacterium]|jgi:hypothetical protein|nr:hypothetical protein [Bacteroidales bacterium]MCU0407500.1 hypothetical protein [Bacteroidales bacterium]
MEKGADNYRKVLELLKSSKPRHKNPDILEEKIMESIRMSKAGTAVSQSFTGFLFGWTRIVWIRRALSATAVLLILFLAFQQSVIIKQINTLNQRLVPGNLGNASYGNAGRIELLLYRLSASGNQYVSSDITGEKIDQLIESFEQMNSKYRELLKLIDEDPELKRLIEQKLDARKEKELPEKIKL